MMQEERERLASGLSFKRITDDEPALETDAAASGSIGSPQTISAACLPRELDETSDRQGDVEEVEVEEEEEDEFSGEDFEFSFVSTKPETIAADEIFTNGQIRSIYPVFNRDIFFQRGGEDSDDSSSTSSSSLRMPFRQLLIEEKELSAITSSESHELERVPENTYCVWTPRSVPASPDLPKKSNSTGSSSRWRLRDLVVGRSHSDGKDKFVFLHSTAPHPAAPEKKSPETETKSPTRSADPTPKSPSREEKKGKGKGKVRATEMDMVTAHRLFYSKGGVGGDRRRSFLPYRKDLVGFFGN